MGKPLSAAANNKLTVAGSGVDVGAGVGSGITIAFDPLSTSDPNLKIGPVALENANPLDCVAAATAK